MYEISAIKYEIDNYHNKLIVPGLEAEKQAGLGSPLFVYHLHTFWGVILIFRIE